MSDDPMKLLGLLRSHDLTRERMAELALARGMREKRTQRLSRRKMEAWLEPFLIREAHGEKAEAYKAAPEPPKAKPPRQPVKVPRGPKGAAWLVTIDGAVMGYLFDRPADGTPVWYSKLRGREPFPGKTRLDVVEFMRGRREWAGATAEIVKLEVVEIEEARR